MLVDKRKGGERQPEKAGAVRHPEKNRRLLIAATLDSIVDHGIAETTVTRIIERAGLSRGMVHLHFGGKENLLSAAAEAFNLAYFDEMERCIAGKAADPAGLVRAVIQADLSEALLNRRSTRIWHAFRGAAATSPGIARFSSTRDKRLHTMVRGAFGQLAGIETAGESATLARDATYGTLALLEGMWTDFLMHESDFDRGTAVRIVHRFVAALFPRHF